MKEGSEIIECKLCDKKFEKNEEYVEHNWTLIHHVKLEKSSAQCKHECTLCNILLNHFADFCKHLETQIHKNNETTYKLQQQIARNPILGLGRPESLLGPGHPSVSTFCYGHENGSKDNRNDTPQFRANSYIGENFGRSSKKYYSRNSANFDRHSKFQNHPPYNRTSFSKSSSYRWQNSTSYHQPNFGRYSSAAYPDFLRDGFNQPTSNPCPLFPPPANDGYHQRLPWHGYCGGLKQKHTTPTDKLRKPHDKPTSAEKIEKSVVPPESVQKPNNEIPIHSSKTLVNFLPKAPLSCPEPNASEKGKVSSAAVKRLQKRFTLEKKKKEEKKKHKALLINSNSGDSSSQGLSKGQRKRRRERERKLKATLEATSVKFVEDEYRIAEPVSWTESSSDLKAEADSTTTAVVEENAKTLPKNVPEERNSKLSRPVHVGKFDPAMSYRNVMRRPFESSTDVLRRRLADRIKRYRTELPKSVGTVVGRPTLPPWYRSMSDDSESENGTPQRINEVLLSDVPDSPAQLENSITDKPSSSIRSLNELISFTDDESVNLHMSPERQQVINNRISNVIDEIISVQRQSSPLHVANPPSVAVPSVLKDKAEPNRKKRKVDTVDLAENSDVENGGPDANECSVKKKPLNHSIDEQATGMEEASSHKDSAQFSQVQTSTGKEIASYFCAEVSSSFSKDMNRDDETFSAIAYLEKDDGSMANRLEERNQQEDISIKNVFSISAQENACTSTRHGSNDDHLFGDSSADHSELSKWKMMWELCKQEEKCRVELLAIDEEIVEHRKRMEECEKRKATTESQFEIYRQRRQQLLNDNAHVFGDSSSMDTNQFAGNAQHSQPTVQLTYLGMVNAENPAVRNLIDVTLNGPAPNTAMATATATATSTPYPMESEIFQTTRFVKQELE